MNERALTSMQVFLQQVAAQPDVCLDARGARELGFATQGAADSLGIPRFYPTDTQPRNERFIGLADTLCLRFNGNGAAFDPLMAALTNRLRRFEAHRNGREHSDFEVLLQSIDSVNLRRPALYVGVHSYSGLIQYLRGALAATLIHSPDRESELMRKISRVEAKLRDEIGVEYGPWYELIRMVSWGADTPEGLERFMAIWFDQSCRHLGSP